MENRPRHNIEVNFTWDGQRLTEPECAVIGVEVRPECWVLYFSAPFDPRTRLPATNPGPTEGLWEYEVTELFVAGEAGHYLELEVGPCGHFAAFYFEKVRHRKRTVELLYTSFKSQLLSPGRGSFEAEIHLAHSELPGGNRRWNAYRITGNPGARHYYAAHPVIGVAPDFHRLECFATCPV